MVAGRIETYIHSDSITENKGVAIVKVIAVTDFASRTPVFKAFAHDAALHVYAALAHTRSPFVAGPEMWSMVIAKYPALEDQRIGLEHELGEVVRITEIAIMRL
jgi:translation elongation factor EF-Ts